MKNTVKRPAANGLVQGLSAPPGVYLLHSTCVQACSNSSDTPNMASRNMRAGDVASASVVCTRTSISTPPGPLGCRVSGDGGSHAALRDTCAEADLDFGHGRDSTLALRLASLWCCRCHVEPRFCRWPSHLDLICFPRFIKHASASIASSDSAHAGGSSTCR